MALAGHHVVKAGQETGEVRVWMGLEQRKHAALFVDELGYLRGGHEAPQAWRGLGKAPADERGATCNQGSGGDEGETRALLVLRHVVRV